MIISLNWLKKYTKIDMPVAELSTLIGARLVEIEESIDLNEKYKDVLIVRVVEASKIEGSDHLNLTKIDDGKTINDIERDENGLIQVVCGAPNVRAGQLVVWLPPNSIVPQTFNKPDKFILGSRKLRGHISNGMIASAQELDLSDDHEGILEIFDDIKPGTFFADAFEMRDTLLDIANKSLTHRPDCFGVIGFAREVSAIQGVEFNNPEILNRNSSTINVDSSEVSLSVKIDDSKMSSRYLAVAMSVTGSNIKSPFLTQTYLSRVGVRPINAIVDVTNYLMMLTGQPLHAFDYDKVIALNNGKAEIHVRPGIDGEKLVLLDGRTIELVSDDIVIASGDVAIGLAGAMGGLSTAIDNNTKNIIIESATFNLYNLRSTQMRHGIFSEAITRFTKGQPAELSSSVLAEAVDLIKKWVGAKTISNVAEDYPEKQQNSTIECSVNKINELLGSNFSDNDIVKTLSNIGFVVGRNNDLLSAVAPYWRSDIHIVEDIVEEVGRLNGFDNINPTLPLRDFYAVRPSNFDSFRKDIRKLLIRAGSNEVLTYSFIHGDIIKKSNQNVDNSYKIINSISPELQYYRQSLTPSLIDLIHPNIKQGYSDFALFEMNKVHQKSDGLNEESVPNESNRLGLVVSRKVESDGSPYYRAKNIFEYVCGVLGVSFAYLPLENNEDSLFAPYEVRRSAKIINLKNNALIGVVGEYRKQVADSFKLPVSTAGFEIDMDAFFESTKDLGNNYKKLSRYPYSERDICFRVKSDVVYDQIIIPVKECLTGIDMESYVSPIDIYQINDVDTKNITIRIKLVSHDHTLISDEVNNVIDMIIKSVKQSIDADVI